MIDFERARRLAAELVARQNLTSPPVDAEPIARLQKVSVRFVSFNGEAKQQVCAYSEPDRSITVNRDQSPEYKNYAIAHELAHFLLHPGYVESGAYRVLLQGTPIGGGVTDQEKDADVFAAELLVPQKMLAAYRTVSNPDDLTSRFVAPVQMIRAQWALAGP